MKASRNIRKNRKSLTASVLAFIIAITPLHSYPQEVPNGSNEQLESQLPMLQVKLNETEQLPPISIKVSEPMPENQISIEKISAQSSVFMLTPEMYKATKKYLHKKFWQPIKIKTSEVFGYLALNIPEVAADLKEAFRHPLSSGKNVTIVTTFLGVSSTITSFTIGNIYANDASSSRLLATGVLLLGLSALYRSNFDAVGALLNYSGWRWKDVKKNIALQKIYEENIKNLKDEKPAGLVEEKFSKRLIKMGLIELFFLAAVGSWDFIFPTSQVSNEFIRNFTIANMAYTLSSVYEMTLTRLMIKQKINVSASSPKEIELKQNKIAFAFISLSIGLSFLQNLAVVPALSGSKYFQGALLGIGGTMIAYEYFSTRLNRSPLMPEALSCSALFLR